MRREKFFFCTRKARVGEQEQSGPDHFSMDYLVIHSNYLAAFELVANATLTQSIVQLINSSSCT